MHLKKRHECLNKKTLNQIRRKGYERSYIVLTFKRQNKTMRIIKPIFYWTKTHFNELDKI